MLQVLLLVGMMVPAATAPQVQQIIREVRLDPNVQVHPVQVVGWPGMTTAIQFTDSFESVNVLCGQCTEVEAGEADTPQVLDEKRNWIIEKRVAERSIHVRPALIPSKKVPASAFTTNIYVGMNGGHSVNIALSLLHPASLLPDSVLGADAVVTLTLPREATLTGKLAAARQRIFEDFEKQALGKSHTLMLERLAGDVRCRSIRWRKPYRTDKAVIRLNQLCFSAGPRKTFWATFELENRGDAELYVQGASLEPEAAVSIIPDPVTFVIDKDMLAFGETAQGIALCSLQNDSDVPSAWRLRVTPASPDRRPIDVEHLAF